MSHLTGALDDRCPTSLILYPEWMICVPKATLPYCFSRHSYSAITSLAYRGRVSLCAVWAPA